MGGGARRDDSSSWLWLRRAPSMKLKAFPLVTKTPFGFPDGSGWEVKYAGSGGLNLSRRSGGGVVRDRRSSVVMVVPGSLLVGSLLLSTKTKSIAASLQTPKHQSNG